VLSYNYQAINDMGRRVRGELAADNEFDLESRLKQLGLELVSAREVRAKKPAFYSRVRMQDMIVLCLHLEQLSRAGVPLLDALADVRDATESDKLRDVMAGVYESVKNGDLLSQSLAKYPKIFNEVFVGLVRAGEKTGDLSGAYQHLIEHMKWTDELRRKVKKATRYPTVLVVVMGVVIFVLMTQVVPKLVKFITSQGFDIPIHTRALIHTSKFFEDYWWVVFGTPIIVYVTVQVLRRTSEAFAYRWDKLMLHMPVTGKVVRKINLARFTHFFAVMFNSGIDILESLESAKNVVNNRVLKESIATAKKGVTEGSSVTAALRTSNQFPNLVVRMFKVGEDSGNMEEALENVNFFYNREVNDAVEGLVSLIQPILTAVMGILILWVVAGVFGPLYDSFSKMNF
jgi:type IV pilus assembly protein PilC